MENLVKDIKELRNYIEENIRASSNSGINFIDPRGFQSQINNKQNHVIFGRRGSGKTSLLKQLQTKSSNTIYLNLESYKDISFPNIIVHILIKFFKELLLINKKNTIFYTKIFKKYRTTQKIINDEINSLNILISEQDIYSEEINKKNIKGIEKNKRVNVKKNESGLNYDKKDIEHQEIDIKRTNLNIKLDNLKNKIEDFKSILKNVAINKENPLYLIFDDYYFIKINDQPALIDYFHRLTKDTFLYIKLATIRHRTRLYHAKETYIGIEIGGDALEIDLDYTLDNFDSVKSFMEEILKSAIKSINSELKINDIFSGDGFNQLCIASGGVPRDFLALLIKGITKYIIAGEKKVGKIEINEEAISNVSNKYQAIKKDIIEESELVDLYITYLKDKVYREKRTNCFLVSQDEIRSNAYGKQAIYNLFDLRLIHLVDKNTSSAPSDGKRYEAYIIDIGLYDNSRPRGFKQIDPILRDNKSRQDELRASPKIYLNDFINFIDVQSKELGIKNEIDVVEEK